MHLIHPFKVQVDCRTVPSSDYEESVPVMTPTIENSVLNILESISGNSMVRENLDIALFEQDILDSFDLMSVIIELSDTLHVEISPAEVEREAWSTPRKIVAFVENRANQ
jgi:D-alanine--poly(phosphoribitol) ligase subunit 2